MEQASKLAYLKRRTCEKRKIQVISQTEGEKGLKQEEQKEQERKSQMKPMKDDLSQLNASFDSEEELDTNVVGIDFNFLKNTDNIAMGDPVICKSCKAVLNKYSKIFTSAEYLEIQKNLQESRVISKEEQKENDFVMINQKGLEIEEHEKVWKCEFCNEDNKIRIEPEEIPQTEDVIYIVESVDQQVQQKKDESDFSIVFCLDNSGSMSVTSEVKGEKVNLKHGLTEEEYNMLKQFIDQGDEHQMMPGQNKNITYISRKQCVLAAIEQQLSDMTKEHPDRKVGVVTFSDEVIILGDGHSKEPLTITGDKLYKTDEIKQATLNKTQDLLKHTIKDSIKDLTQKFDKLEEKGRTALGPALLSAITMAGQGKPGSMVVICTDGLANLGIGSLDQDEDTAKQFYSKLTETAKEQGIVISVITIKGEGCKIEILGQLAEETNGTVTRVDPSDISKDFANILQDEVVGTKVSLEIQLHKALQFRNEDQCYISDNGSKYNKNIGNATVNTKITFEYQSKTDELLQEQKIDIDQLKQLPFQARIYYNNLKGDKYLRVLSQIQKATSDREEAEKQVQVKVLHNRIAQQSANYVQQGRFKNAQKYNSKWNHYVQENEQINSVELNQQDNLQFQEVNHQWKKCANKKVSRNVASSRSKPQSKSEKTGGFMSKVKGIFTSSSSKEKSYEDEQGIQEKVEPQQQMKSCIQEEQNDDVMFSASDEGYSSDEDKDEAMMINFKQGKMKKK